MEQKISRHKELIKRMSRICLIILFEIVVYGIFNELKSEIKSLCVFIMCMAPFLIWFCSEKYIEMNIDIFSENRDSRTKNAIDMFVLAVDAEIIALFFDRIILLLLYKLVAAYDILLKGYLEQIRFFSFWRIQYWFIFIFIILLVFYLGFEKSFQNRYILAAVLFIYLVMGQYHGSSIGYLSGMLVEHTENYDKTTLIGINQGLRGDEWAVDLPLSIGQCYSDEKFPYYNDNLMINGCDVMVSAKLPVNDVLALFNPLKWGYYFLPIENAVAFGWWLPLFAVFLSSIDMMYELCRKKKVSVAYGGMILFSPCVQWWYSISVLIFSGQYLIVALNRFLVEKGKVKRILLTAFASLCANTFMFVIYPAWEIPFLYFFLILIVWVFWRNWEGKPLKKENILAYFMVLLSCMAFGIRFLLLSGEAMQVQLNTTYPGNIRAWEMVPIDIFLLQIINVFMSFGKYSTYMNNCEISQFYGMFFWSFILWISIVRKKAEKIREKRLISILVIFNLLLLYYIFGPQLPHLYNITLLSFSYPRRMLSLFGYSSMVILMLLLGCCIENKMIDKGKAKIFAAVCFVIVAGIAVNNNIIREYVNGSILFFVFVIVVIGIWAYTGYTIISGHSLKRGITFLLVISVASSAFVNPVQRGLDDLFESSLISKIYEISEQSTGRWLVSGNSTISNIVTACGIKRLTGTYVYPDIPMFEIIDPDHDYEDSWNRYAHIDMELSNENRIESFGAGLNVGIDVETAQKLDAEYWVINRVVDTNMFEGVDIVQIYNSAEWYIYKLIYK